MTKDQEKTSAIIIRNVPESTRRRLKSVSAEEGKPMQRLVLELIIKYLGGVK
jgi:predicted DNA-binding protein